MGILGFFFGVKMNLSGSEKSEFRAKYMRKALSIRPKPDNNIIDVYGAWVRVRIEFYYGFRRDMNCAIVLSRLVDRADENFVGLSYNKNIESEGRELTDYEKYQKRCYDQMVNNKNYYLYARCGGWVMFQSDYWVHKLGMQEGQLHDSLQRLEACGLIEVTRSRSMGNGRGIRLVRLTDEYHTVMAKCIRRGRKSTSGGDVDVLIASDFLTYAQSGVLIDIPESGPLPEGLVPDRVTMSRKTRKGKSLPNLENLDSLPNLENANLENTDLQGYAGSESVKSRLGNLENPDLVDQKIQTRYPRKSRLGNLENPDLRNEVLGNKEYERGSMKEESRIATQSDDCGHAGPFIEVVSDIQTTQPVTGSIPSCEELGIPDFAYLSANYKLVIPETKKPDRTSTRGFQFPKAETVSAAATTADYEQPPVDRPVTWEDIQSKMLQLFPSNRDGVWETDSYDFNAVSAAYKAGFRYAVRVDKFRELTELHKTSPLKSCDVLDADGDMDPVNVQAVVQAVHVLKSNLEDVTDYWNPIQSESARGHRAKMDSRVIANVLAGFPEGGDFRRNFKSTLRTIYRFSQEYNTKASRHLTT